MSMTYIADNMDRTLLETLMERIATLEMKVEKLEKEVARLKFLALPKDMSLADQYKALEEHKNTPMTYSEMRERFG